MSPYIWLLLATRVKLNTNYVSSLFVLHYIKCISDTSHVHRDVVCMLTFFSNYILIKQYVLTVIQANLNVVFPVCGVEQLYLLSAVAGRKQEDRPSIRPQNKVKRLLSVRDLIPG